LTHVPYRGSTPAITDLIAGQVQVMFDVTPTAVPQIKGGKLRGLAVTTANRLDVLPDLPPIADFVKGYEATAWIGVGAPKGTPTQVVATLNKQINSGLLNATIQKRLADLGAQVVKPMTPTEFGKHIADDAAKWSNVIKSAGIKPN
jgi:tripartite-type tricarboxylate transporter receptor subunit TctC